MFGCCIEIGKFTAKFQLESGACTEHASVGIELGVLLTVETIIL
jgi:hypothetical protein